MRCGLMPAAGFAPSMETTAVMMVVASLVAVLVKIMAVSILSRISPRVGGSHDGRRMVHFRNADAHSADDRTDQVDRVSQFRQRKAARPRVLCRPPSGARAGRASERHRGFSVLRHRRAAGGVSRRPATPDR